MRRRHRRLQEEADLDITAFMNLMIVLVPILLINMIFAHTSLLELNFPDKGALSSEDLDQLQLQIIVSGDSLVVADSVGGVIKTIASNVDTKAYDYKTLGEVMQELKARVPDKKDITLMPQQDTSYQTLISLMDAVRSYKAVVAGSEVDAELFPDISIADAPELVSDSDVGG
jgi:biopolymer transport protein ExbD